MIQLLLPYYKIFYIYAHCTKQNVPFYIGKGCHSRAYCVNTRRSKEHKNNLNLFGLNLKFLFYSYDEYETYVMESELIKKYHTYINDIDKVEFSCNKNTGGKGNYTQSIESRQKRSLALKGKPKKRDKKYFRAVIQYSKELIEINRFDSVKDAAIYTNVNRTSISQCCLGNKNYPSAGGFVWKFVNFDLTTYKKVTRSLQCRENISKKISKKVYQCDKQNNIINVFQSLSSLQKCLKINYHLISNYCKKIIPQPDDFNWYFECDAQNLCLNYNQQQ